MKFDIQKSNEEKSKLQEEVSLVTRIYDNIIIEGATGVGKTAMALKCIERYKSTKPWLVVVPEVTLIKNFLDDVEKNNPGVKDQIIDVICYASLHKYENTSYNLLLDEGHCVGSDMRIDYLSSIKADKRLMLSATISDDIRTKLSTICKWHTVEITLEDAVERGILPAPDIRVVSVDLDDNIRDYPYKFKSKTVKLTAKGYYSKISDSVKYWMGRWDDEGLPWQYTKFLSEATNRKRWIASYKTDLARDIIKELNNDNKRFICFCGSIDQAKKLGGKKAIHSKNTDVQNAQIIEKFNNEETSSLFSCNMGRQGQNFYNIQGGILIQLDGDTLYTIQRIGRVLRSTEPIIYILLVKGTQDMKYFEKVKEKINPNWITYV